MTTFKKISKKKTELQRPSKVEVGAANVDQAGLLSRFGQHSVIPFL